MAKIKVVPIHGLKGVFLLDKRFLDTLDELQRAFDEYTFSIDFDKCEGGKVVYKATLKHKATYFKPDRDKPYTRTETKKPPE